MGHLWSQLRRIGNYNVPRRLCCRFCRFRPPFHHDPYALPPAARRRCYRRPGGPARGQRADPPLRRRHRGNLAAPGGHGAARIRGQHPLAVPGGRPGHGPGGGGYGLADGHAPLSRPGRVRVGPGAAPGGAGLCAGLRLYGPAAVRRPGADLVAGDLRLEQGRLLVPRGAQPPRRRRHVRVHPLRLRLSAGPGGFPGAGLGHAGSGADARCGALGQLLPRLPAPGPAGHRGRRFPGPDGNPGRLRHRRLLRRADLHHRHLPGLVLFGRPHRRGPAGRSLLGCVILLVLLEKLSRGRARFHNTTGRSRPLAATPSPAGKAPWPPWPACCPSPPAFSCPPPCC